MSDQVLKERLGKNKNFKIQIYERVQIGEDEPMYAKRYIYPKYKKDSGGLFAYFRQSSLAETLAAESAETKVNAQFIVNWNSKITDEMFIEFKNPITQKRETYGIVGMPDIYEGYKADITLNCSLVIDSTTYDREEYYE